MKIRVVITGRAYHVAQAVPKEITLNDDATIDDALAVIASHLDEGQQLPIACLIAIGGKHVGSLGSHEATPLTDGIELVLIAPVAGG